MKRALSLVMALAMLFALLAGCNSTAPDASGNPAASNTPGEATATPDTTTPEGSYVYTPLYDPNVPADKLSDLQVTIEDVPSAKTIDLPLSDESVQISAYITFKSDLYASITDTPVDQELRRRTNVEVIYQTASTTNATESFQLMIASNNYPDIIFDANTYIGGGDKGISDGVFLRHNELIAEYAPNYTAIRSLSPDHLRGTITDTGNIYGFFCLLIDAEPPWCGLTVREDWLDDLGLSVPVTLADWENMMDAFINEKGAEYGVAINPAYIRANNNDEFITSFDVNYSFYQVGGKVQYGPTQQGFLDYLTMANEWYQKGYIDPEFFEYSNYGEYLQGDAYTKYGESNIGAAQTMGLATGLQLYTNSLSTNSDMWITAVKNPVRNAGDTIHFRQLTSPVKTSGGGSTAAISTQAANPELCAKWLDYRYTQDGLLLFSYGVTGYNFAFDEGTGLVTYTKDFVEYEDGLQKAYDFFTGYEFINTKASIYSRVRGSIYTGQVYEDMTGIWATDGHDYVIPVDAGFATPEDSAEYSTIYADIQTYLDEMTIRFITGAEPLSNFQQFVDRINSMNIERCTEIKQAGLDAYNSRPLN